MLGAIIGDIIGSVYEFNNIKTKDFPLWNEQCNFTDDTVMTVAVAAALLLGGLSEDFVATMKKFGELYPNAGYGGAFRQWLLKETSLPYNSFGNGSAMRVSPVAWACDTIADAQAYAEMSAAVTHNHPEGIKGAQATATAIYLARQGETKEAIKTYIEHRYGYDLSRSLDEIRPLYKFNETCQETVPQAIIAFLESTGFEDAIRNAVSLGGDSDTLAAITGSIAEAAYGIPKEIEEKALSFLPKQIVRILTLWKNAFLRPIATKDSWENKPIINPKEVALKLRLSNIEYALLKRGLIPDAMEDKWFIYFEDEWLYFHRSWTGEGIFKAKVSEVNGVKVIDTFFVESASGHNENTNDNVSTIMYLIGRGLLKREMPLSDALSQNVLAAWGEFGRMIAESVTILVLEEK